MENPTRNDYRVLLRNIYVNDDVKGKEMMAYELTAKTTSRRWCCCCCYRKSCYCVCISFHH